MAFVPGHKHDLFLSYAHAEAAWVEAFRKALCDEFQVRTGEPLTVWKDSQELRLGQKWVSQIEEGIRSAAAFLVIVSPIYLKSPWCARERAIALEKTLEALRVESFYRFLKIIKTPGPGDAHEELLAALQDLRFFNKADGYEHPADSAEFIATIRACVRQVRELLTLMSNRGQEIYLAPAAIEMHKEREELERELKDRGFTLKPDVLLDSGFGKGPLLKAMDKVSLVVFVLGSVYDEFTTDQIKAATELGRPCVFWVQPGERQRKMLGSLLELKDLPSDSEILGGRSIREMIPQLLEKLQPRAAAEAAKLATDKQRVYLNYDSTLPEDSRLAMQIEDWVSQQEFEVVRSGRDGGHDQLMRTCDAVLLFRAATPNPDEWLKLNAMELALATQIFERKPNFPAKALLVADPARIRAQAPGVPIYSYAVPFVTETLGGFFDKVRKARASAA